MRRLAMVLALATLAAGCATTPPPDPITLDEMVTLAKGGADSPALEQALDNRPLGFALTYENMKELESRGVPPDAIDRIVSSTMDRRARQMAPRYYARPYYYDPFYGPYYDPWYGGPYWRFGFGYHWYR